MKIQLHAQDIQLERFFLALIRYRPAWEATHGMISPSYFSSDDRRKIYAAISTAYEADAFLDRVTLPLLSGKASSDEIGYLNIQPEDIDRDAPSIAAYMADRYARRKALEEAIKYYDCQSSYESLLNSLGELEGDATATKPAPLETGDQWMAKEAAQFRSIGRLATGFQHLDQYLNWSPGNIYVLTADTGKGKTLMAHELAFGYAHTHGEIAGIIGLELSREEVAFRWEQSRTVEDAAYIHHPKRTNWTPTSACREITNRAKQGVRFWVVDHFMLFSKDDGKQNQTEFEANTARQLESAPRRQGLSFWSWGSTARRERWERI
jgi:replicative DNA helicase